MGPELIDFFFGCGHSCNFMHASRFLYCRGPILESIEVTKGQGISFMKDRLGDTCFVEIWEGSWDESIQDGKQLPEIYPAKAQCCSVFGIKKQQ